MQNWKRTFYLIWSGELISTLTSSIVGYAVVFWLSVETKSAEVLTYAMLASLLPQVLLGMFTGVFVDRWHRKWTMIGADSFIALCTGILSILFYTGIAEIWQVYILLAMRSIGSAFHTPAMQASIPLLAPESQLMHISGVNQIIYSICNIAGPAIAAVLITIMDMSYVLLLDIGGAVIACSALLFVTIPNPKKNVDVMKQPHIFKEIKEGLSAIFEKRGLGWIFTFDIISTFFVLPIAALFPLMTLNYFEGKTFDMSLVEIVWGIGSLAGGGLLGIRKMKLANKVLIINIADIVLGLMFMLSGLLPPSGFIGFLIFMSLGGVAGTIFMGAFTVILQTQISSEKLGRVFAMYGSITLLPSIPGLLATSFIAENIGLPHSFIIAGFAIICSAVILLFIPSVRKLGRSTIGLQSPE